MTWIETRRIPVLLAAATLIPIGALSWLGVSIWSTPPQQAGEEALTSLCSIILARGGWALQARC